MEYTQIFADGEVREEFLDRFEEIRDAVAASGGLESVGALEGLLDFDRAAGGVKAMAEGTWQGDESGSEAIVRQFGRPVYLVRRNTFATAADAPDNDAESLVVAARVKAACLPAPPAPPLRPGPHERVPPPYWRNCGAVRPSDLRRATRYGSCMTRGTTTRPGPPVIRTPERPQLHAEVGQGGALSGPSPAARRSPAVSRHAASARFDRPRSSCTRPASSRPSTSGSRAGRRPARSRCPGSAPGRCGRPGSGSRGRRSRSRPASPC